MNAEQSILWLNACVELSACEALIKLDLLKLNSSRHRKALVVKAHLDYKKYALDHAVPRPQTSHFKGISQ